MRTKKTQKKVKKKKQKLQPDLEDLYHLAEEAREQESLVEHPLLVAQGQDKRQNSKDYKSQRIRGKRSAYAHLLKSLQRNKDQEVGGEHGSSSAVCANGLLSGKESTSILTNNATAIEREHIEVDSDYKFVNSDNAADVRFSVVSEATGGNIDDPPQCVFPEVSATFHTRFECSVNAEDVTACLDWTSRRCTVEIPLVGTCDAVEAIPLKEFVDAGQLQRSVEDVCAELECQTNFAAVASNCLPSAQLRMWTDLIKSATTAAADMEYDRPPPDTGPKLREPVPWRGQDVESCVQWTKCINTPLLRALWAAAASHLDVDFLCQNAENGHAVRMVYMLHVANHIYQMRDRVWKNGAEIKRRFSAGDFIDEVSESCMLRDQGTSRPRVLILVPLRAVAFEVIQILSQLLPNAKQVVLKNRFIREYGPDVTTDEEISRRERMRRTKSRDFLHLFEGNCDQDFTMGIQVRATVLRLYADLRDSDIIVASPVGLKNVAERLKYKNNRTDDNTANVLHGCGEEGNSSDEDTINDSDNVGTQAGDALQQHTQTTPPINSSRAGTEGDEGLMSIHNSSSSSDEGDYSFLSSIELMVADRLDVGYQQNWNDVLRIFKVLNTKPTSISVDIRRIRKSYASGNSRFLRQTLLLADGRCKDIAQLRRKYCHNHRGAVSLWQPSGEVPCVVSRRSGDARQLFLFCQISKPAKTFDDILRLFRVKLFDTFMRRMEGPTLIVIPTYLEFVALRKVLKEILSDRTEYVVCHDYTSKSEATKAEAQIVAGSALYWIVTERYIFFRRPAFRGVSNAVFLPVPQLASTYLHCVNAVCSIDGDHVVCAVFTKLQSSQLERLVGCTKAVAMLQGSIRQPSGKIFVVDGHK
eukprot:Lankesteria_metandrocarpae@DN652_c0_g1_i1.p2